MNKNILITDSLFVFDDHVKAMEREGFTVQRLDKPDASENELVAALGDKHGYILGGIEHVTENVLRAAHNLEVISFTGSGYAEFIPAHDFATRRGIAISAAIGANALDVAEFTLALIMEMVRNLPLLQGDKSRGGKGFFVARRLRGMTLGVVGYGHVGREVARLGEAVGFNVIVSTSQSPKGRDQGAARFVPLDTLLEMSDIVTIHVSKINGVGVLGAPQISKMKVGSILVNAAFPEAIDVGAAFQRVLAKEVRVAFDAPPPIVPGDIGLGYCVASNAQTAFNTREANRAISDRVTKSMINLLSTGRDTDLVNPQYQQYRRR